MIRFGIEFDPVLATPLIVVLAVALAATVALVLWRRLRGGLWRALAAALVVLALLNPVLKREERERLPGTVAIIVDESASQSLGERRQQAETALAALRGRIESLGGFQIREVRAGDTVSATADDGTELFSRLGQAMNDVPADQVAGAILLTDGIVHDIPENAGQLGFDAPVHALITGADGEKDRRIEILRAPRYAILGEPQTIDFRVHDPALPPGTPLAVVLRVDGETIRVERAANGETRTVDVPIDHAGPTVVELEVEGGVDELTTANNVGVASIDVVREHLRVLLVSGEPHAGERTWRNVLKSDAAVDLVHFTILRPPEKQDGTPINELSLIAFPTRELFFEKIDEFDLIIFDRYRRRGVLPVIYLDNITGYIRKGGAVLVAAGPDYASNASLFRTPLGAALPATPTGLVIEEPYHARVTPEGARHPVTRNLPGAGAEPPAWSRWFRLIQAQAVAGSVTMSGAGDEPLLVLAREDEGRIAMLLSDHAWLWARGYEGGGPHGALLRRLVHWLMKEPELEEEALRARAAEGALVVERQTLAESAAPVTVTAPDGTVSELALEASEPGLWRGVLEDAALGLHRVEDGDLRALAHVGPANPREYREVISTTERLQPIAGESGGAAVRLASAGGTAIPRIVAVSPRAPAAGRGWIGLRRSDAMILKSIDRLPLFGGLLGLALLVGGFAALWYREGR